MKKIVLSLALAAFIGGGTLFAMTATNNVTESTVLEMVQDGKKKKSSATKKEDCKTEKSCDKKSKSDCKGNDVLKKKSCCSDGKAAKETKSNPEKK